MPTLGPSVSEANAILNRWRNVPSTYPVTAVALHIGFPGVDGLSAPSAVTDRMVVVFDEPVNGIMNIVGGTPVWDMTDPEAINYISIWSGLTGDDSAIYLAPGILVPGRNVADGDVFNLATCQVKIPGLVAA